MSRMHTGSKGKSKSRKPRGRPKPDTDMSADDIEERVAELAEKGRTPSEIGTALKEEGVPDIKAVTGKKVTQILEEQDLASELPEDLIALVRKAVLIRKHLVDNHTDERAHRGLLLTESKIMRLTRYYKENGKVPQDWNYNPKEASYLAE